MFYNLDFSERYHIKLANSYEVGVNPIRSTRIKFYLKLDSWTVHACPFGIHHPRAPHINTAQHCIHPRRKIVPQMFGYVPRCSIDRPYLLTGRPFADSLPSPNRAIPSFWKTGPRFPWRRNAAGLRRWSLRTERRRRRRRARRGSRGRRPPPTLVVISRLRKSEDAPRRFVRRSNSFCCNSSNNSNNNRWVNIINNTCLLCYNLFHDILANSSV